MKQVIAQTHKAEEGQRQNIEKLERYIQKISQERESLTEKTSERLSYRNASIEDLPQIVSIYNATIPSRMVTADLEPVSVESRLVWFYDHSPEKRPLWMVANKNEETVGWVSFQSFYGRPAYDRTVEISIYVDERHRGAGFGKEILAFCITDAKSRGIYNLLAFIFAQNLPSLKLFRHFGFHDWGILPNVAILDGQERSLHILGKRI